MGRHPKSTGGLWAGRQWEDQICRGELHEGNRFALKALVGRWMKKLSAQVETSIDAICALGCDMVSAYIGALQKGESRPEYQSLDERQRASLLQELQSIMSVYRDRYP